MKRLNYLLFTAAALTLASCADDNSMGVGNESAKSNAVSFGFSVPNMLRSDLVGNDAANQLSNEFVVYGTKHLTGAENASATNDQAVYTNYKVVYSANTAGSSESNSANWEYVGETPYDAATVSPAATGTQTIKYWDYSAANGYTFTAFAGKTELEAGNVVVTKTTDATGNGATANSKGYTVKTAKAEANLNNLYFSDRVEVAKAKYGEPVTLTFRNFGSRVRVGFYETVPGYSVKIDKFYFDDNATEAVTTYKAMDKANTTNFAAAHRSVTPATTNALTVTYDDQNQPTVTNTTVTYSNTLTLGTGVVNTTLGKSATAPSWDQTNGTWNTVYPNEACTTPMLIRCDYTLTAEDGSNEEIHVKNARVVVPAEYMKWKPNYAYTYLFKISDKTNGTTGTTPTDPDNPKPYDPSNPDTSDDPEGLHPITFDAVVVDATTGNQETISTVSTNTVTTYAEGSNVTTNGEYTVNETIKAINTNTSNKTVIVPTADKAKFVKLDKVATESEVNAQLNGSLLGITMTDETSTVDGNYLTFTPAEAGTYAYIYTNTAYKAAVYTSAATATHTTGTVYYAKTTSGVYYPASGISAENFDTYKANLYTLTTTATTGVYDIKVITVK